MKYTLFIISIFIAHVVSAQWTLQTIGSWDSNGKPLYLQSINDTISSADISRLNGPSGYIPAGHDVTLSHPEYIQQTDILINESDSIYVTFVTESAGHKNTLGYYTYTGAAPNTKNDINTVTLIFPNSSNNNSSDLSPGNKINLGYFAAGTTIGWVLFDNAWTADSTVFVDRLPSWTKAWYSDHNLNPGSRAHTVLFNDTIKDRWVLGFEDLDLGDKDYSDVLYYISGHDTDPTSTLPVELISAYFDKHSRFFNWKTASEINNDFFTLNFFNKDGKYINSEFINGAGNSNSIKNYSHYISKDIYYVHLLQTDYDGSTVLLHKEYTGSNNDNDINIYPNPTSNGFNIKGQVSTIEIKTIDGSNVNFNFSNSYVSGLKPGFYFVIINNIYIKKLIVE